MKKLSEDEQICLTLKNFLDTSELRVRNDAVVNRAYADKVSEETISKKVEDQLNAIRYGIMQINPKFKEGHKNYDATKEEILDAMKDYENSLKELSDFYDGKIESLILRKAELQGSLVAALISQDYLAAKVDRKIMQKENDQIKLTLKARIENAFEKLKVKKSNKEELDIRDITRVEDANDIQDEVEEKLAKRVEKSVKDRKENGEQISSIKEEIRLIDEEIERMNDRKSKALMNAMETAEKSISVSIKGPRIFGRVKRFFASRFNTKKVIETTIIEPFRSRINEFKENELSNIEE